jgi:hypothetical protein
MADSPRHDDPLPEGRSPGYSRTRTQVQAFFAALGAARYELGVITSQGGVPPHVRGPQCVPTLVREPHLRWLRYQNAHGADIYVRPDAESCAILLDDLGAVMLQQMRRDGFIPAAIVETSPRNFQAWVRLAPTLRAVGATAVLTMCCRSLQRAYGGDPAAAHWRHFGRLPGFTNQKPSRRQADGRPPYAVLRSASGRIAPAGLALVAQGRVALQEAAALLSPPDLRQAPKIRAPGACVPGGEVAALVGHFAARWEVELRRRVARFGSVDPSRLDFALACEYARKFGLDPDSLTLVLRHGSPNPARHRQPDDYARRTAWAACSATRARS